MPREIYFDGIDPTVLGYTTPEQLVEHREAIRRSLLRSYRRDILPMIEARQDTNCEAYFAARLIVLNAIRRLGAIDEDRLPESTPNE